MDFLVFSSLYLRRPLVKNGYEVHQTKTMFFSWNADGWRVNPFEIHDFCCLQNQKLGSVFLATSKFLNRQENKVVNEIRSRTRV